MRPPTFPSALAAPLAALAAPASAGPAAEVTRDRPWAALDWTFWAVSLAASAAFLACAEAASVVWKRRAAKRRFCLRRGRATTADDIVCVVDGGTLLGVLMVLVRSWLWVPKAGQLAGERRANLVVVVERSVSVVGVDWLGRRVGLKAVAMEVESAAFGLPATLLQTWNQGRARCVLRKFQWSSEQNGLPVLANQRRPIRSCSGSAGYVSSWWWVRTFWPRGSLIDTTAQKWAS